jgi:hypothetical protein
LIVFIPLRFLNENRPAPYFSLSHIRGRKVQKISPFGMRLGAAAQAI